MSKDQQPKAIGKNVLFQEAQIQWQTRQGQKLKGMETWWKEDHAQRVKHSRCLSQWLEDPQHFGQHLLDNPQV